MTDMQKINAGGTLSPDQVIGRDAFIANCWNVLDSQGLYITGERRMGKSSIVRDKMRAEPAKGYKLVYFDVSDADTPLAFVDALFREARSTLGNGAWVKLGAIELFQKLVPGLDTKVFKLPEALAPHWKDMLRLVLAEFASTELRTVLAFDEMPIMLDKIKRGSNESVAMDILDTLRQARQTDTRLRMIYTGSLGLHHVLTDLHNSQYQNAPINDLRPLELGPLSGPHARELAHRLLTGAAVTCSNHELLAQHIATISGGIPFYIQNLIGDIAMRGEDCDTAMADQLLDYRLAELADPWDFGYFIKRIDTHYQSAYAPIALAFLDHLASSTAVLTFQDLLSGVNPRKTPVNAESAQRTLELLGRDHYIIQEGPRAFRFRYPLLARAWAYRRPPFTPKKRR